MTNNESTTSTISIDTKIIRILVPAAAISLLISHIIWPELGIDYVSVILIIVAIVPWLPTLLESAKLPGDVELKFRQISDDVKEQRQYIERQQELINKLVVYSMAYNHYDRLKELHDCCNNNNSYKFSKDDGIIGQLLYLRDNNFIELWGIRGFEDGRDISKDLKITPTGEFYIELREKYESDDRKQSLDG